ncbi:MAG: hypothetical protein HUJ26_03210 [Planctomycetaceae bacterium]|nr:hypothetical protein [Planctomycetaceae bacterium]
MRRFFEFPNPSAASDRRGIATLWLILGFPVFLLLFGVLIEIANLWLARVELKNALDAVSLAAVQHWAETAAPNNPADTLPARQVGVSYANANDVVGVPLALDDNFLLGGVPNQNASCTGDLVFGAVDISDITNIVFDADIRPSCSSGGKVRIDVTKSDSGNATIPRMLGIFYEDGDPNVYISRVDFTIPDFPGRDNQQPYWFGDFGSPGQTPVVSIFDGSDNLNLFNNVKTPLNPPSGSETTDVRGMDPSASSYPGSGDPQSQSVWNNPNNNGDIWFSFSNLINFRSDRYRTLSINFSDDTFNPPADPEDETTIEFVRFGASINNLGPPALDGAYAAQNNNEGDNFGYPPNPVQVSILFRNRLTGEEEVCNTVFVDTDLNPLDNQAVAFCENAGNAYFGVRAQDTTAVHSIWSDLLGIPLGPYDVSARSDAMYDCRFGSPRLVHITTFLCTEP